MPTTTDAFDPFDLPLLAFPPPPDEELRLRDEAEEERRLDALDRLPALFALPAELADLLFEALPLEVVEPVRVEPPAFEPSELLVDRFCLLDELVLAWAMPSPWGRKPCPCNGYPVGMAQNVFGDSLQRDLRAWLQLL
jgi:hypothetical protein